MPQGKKAHEPETQTHEGNSYLLPEDWNEQLRDELDQDYFRELLTFIADDRQTRDVYPSEAQTFAAFHATHYKDVRVVILGQDPYPNIGEAHGLAFSVPRGVAIPPSLRNIFRELQTDLMVPQPNHSNLEGWAKQGVLLLNTALTVRAGTKDDRNAHRNWRSNNQGWDTFTDAVIGKLNMKNEPVVFILWGQDARRKKNLIDSPRHKIIESVHPSPLSAYRGFFGHRPFSRTNEFLDAKGRGTVDWSRFETTA